MRTFTRASAPITARSERARPQAQTWFDQGLQFLYGYNHDEAIRSFQEALVHDPACVMAWWGVSYAAGLHINNPAMPDAKTRLAVEAAHAGLAHLDTATPVERALMVAVAQRYEYPNPEDRGFLDQAYADAMEEAWAAHPADADVGALYAEALMNLQPWDLWTADGEPKGRVLEIVEVLERTLELDSLHPGANHFYIHTVEASNTPERAVPCADRLVDLVPGSGHLVHMPSHIYARVGRYAEATASNQRAIAADQAYFANAPEPDFYSLYFLHNVHFLAYAAMMEGRSTVAFNAARQVEATVPPAFLEEYVMFADGLMSTALHVLIRFGRWEEILEEPAPPEWRLLSRTLRHYARGVACSALGRVEEARAELEAFDHLAPQVPEDWSIGNNPAQTVLPIARGMLVGELRYREGQVDLAFLALREAVALEDGLVYDEPPGWMQPVRHALGALLLEAGRAADAEAVFVEDLKHNPGNGWALLGLEQALITLGRRAEAADVAARRVAAWVNADVEPEAACYCAAGR